MIYLQPVGKLTMQDFIPTHNYGGAAVADYFLAHTVRSYYVQDDTSRLGIIGVAQTSYFANCGLLWAGFYEGFSPSIKDLREAKALSKKFFSLQKAPLYAEVLKSDRVGNSFARFMGMTPSISNRTIQLYERLN